MLAEIFLNHSNSNAIIQKVLVVFFQLSDIVEQVNKLNLDQSSQHIETSQFICTLNQFTGFCMIRTLALNGLVMIASQNLSGLEMKKYGEFCPIFKELL